MTNNMKTGIITLGLARCRGTRANRRDKENWEIPRCVQGACLRVLVDRSDAGTIPTAAVMGCMGGCGSVTADPIDAIRNQLASRTFLRGKW